MTLRRIHTFETTGSELFIDDVTGDIYAGKLIIGGGGSGSGGAVVKTPSADQVMSGEFALINGQMGDSGAGGFQAGSIGYGLNGRGDQQGVFAFANTTIVRARAPTTNPVGSLFLQTYQGGKIRLNTNYAVDGSPDAAVIDGVNVGIGTPTPVSPLHVVKSGGPSEGSLSSLHVDSDFVGIAGNQWGIYSQALVNPAVDSSANFIGSKTGVYIGGTHNFSGPAITAIHAQLSYAGSGLADAIYGVQADVSLSSFNGPGGGTVNKLAVLNGLFNNGLSLPPPQDYVPGTVVEASGIRVGLQENKVGGTITNFYGVHVLTPSNAGTLSHYYGVYVRDPTGVGSDPWAVYVVGGRSHFGGNVDIGGKVNAGGLTVRANNAAALAAGLVVGDFYRTGADPDVVCVVH